MKKLRGLLPTLAVLLILALWLGPFQNDNPASVPAGQTVQQSSDSVSLTELPAESSEQEAELPPPDAEPGTELPEDGSYTTKEDVSAYLVRYGHLPPNFITKTEAQKAGWKGGGLESVLPGMCIGGDRFGNSEGLLPKAKGRQWRECDINTLGKNFRGAERLVYSNDGLIYYTADHYDSFTQLY